MRVFWARGYEATGVDDLADAMGISMSTFYASFGDKETLFKAALERYEGIYDMPAFLSRAKPVAILIKNLLDENARRLTRDYVNAHRNANRSAIEERLLTAQRIGELGKNVDVRGLAQFLINTMQGMSIQARCGASEGELLTIGEWAMKAWPG
jgi:TetR/AcrR family transcriptional regulator, copper-responsive repressor